MVPAVMIFSVLSILLSLSLSLCPSACAVEAMRLPRMRYAGSHGTLLASEFGDLKSRCSLRWFENSLDHFSYNPSANQTSFEQRVFICDEYHARERPVVFFYTGNEADVELYLNSNGLMWTLAKEMGATLVFAEHRYYGKSGPNVDIDKPDQLQFLTAEQALADYATIIEALRSEMDGGASRVPFIAFGGSYGGMLASWLRMKYPHAVDGAIAGSAPILQFVGMDPPVSWDAYNAVVTKDAAAYPHCADNVRRSWPLLLKLADSASGLDTIGSAMRLCDPVKNVDDVWALIEWVNSAFSFLAMGDYPYRSSYMTNGLSFLPAWPMKHACANLAMDPTAPEEDGQTLLAGLAAAASVFYNHTGSQCNDWNANVNKQTARDGYLWNWQYCTEMFMPLGTDGVHDMFWYAPWNSSAAEEACLNEFGIRPRALWPKINFGGRSIGAASNIVFSNGDLDPWHPGGVLEAPSESSSIIALLIPQAAHHLDLFWPNANDTEAVIHARLEEKRNIQTWIDEAYGEHSLRSIQTEEDAAPQILSAH